MRNWTAEEFEEVIWGDECSLEKSPSLECRLKNEKLSAQHRKKGKGVLFLGEKSRDLLSLCCEISECKGVPQVAGEPCPSGPATH